jgi:hypothetical protein
MKAKTILTVLLCFAVAAVCLAAQGTHTGTWKLNESKSKLASGVVKNHTVVYDAAGDNTKVTVDGTDSQGNTVHSEWTGKFDGQDYAVTGDPSADTRSYVMVDANTMTFANKKGGKIIITGRIVASADGKSRTVTTRGTNAKGKTFESVAAYDKQ